MIISVTRKEFLQYCTTGRLLIDQADMGIWTLEPTVRMVKIWGKTAIPIGTYRVVVDFSNHFQRELPHILNVPGFDGVRIHPGNTDHDTEGCIVLGLDHNVGMDFVGRSVVAFNLVFEKIQAAIARDEIVEIDIS